MTPLHTCMIGPHGALNHIVVHNIRPTSFNSFEFFSNVTVRPHHIRAFAYTRACDRLLVRSQPFTSLHLAPDTGSSHPRSCPSTSQSLVSDNLNASTLPRSRRSTTSSWYSSTPATILWSCASGSPSSVSEAPLRRPWSASIFQRQCEQGIPEG